MGYLQDKFPGMMAGFEQFLEMASSATQFLAEKAKAVGDWAKDNYEKINMAD